MEPALEPMIRDGHLELPTEPGWGVEINEDEVAKHPHVEVWYAGLGKSRQGLTVK